MKRSYSLDLLRLALAYVVAGFHFGLTIPPGPRVTVQIFFVVSGYFLGRKYYTRTHTDPGKQYPAWQYTVDHVKPLYPHMVLALVLFLGYVLLRAFLVFLGAPTLSALWDMVTTAYDQLPDLLFLQSSYQYGANLNNPTWQISAMVIGGYFVYALLCHNEKLSRTILFPGAILVIQGILHHATDLFSYYGPFFLPLLRAFAPMSVGVLTWWFSTTQYYAALKAHKGLFNLLTLAALPAMMLYEDRNGMHLVWSALLVLGCMEPDTLLDRLLGHKCFAGCAKLSYVIYLEHALLGRFYGNILQTLMAKAGIVLGEIPNCIVYFVFLTAVCILLDKILEWILKMVRGRKPVNI